MPSKAFVVDQAEGALGLRTNQLRLWLSLATDRRSFTGGVSDALLAGRVGRLLLRNVARS
jgi:hypothetical protein